MWVKKKDTNCSTDGCSAIILNSCPELQGKNLCKPCLNNALHVSSCKQLNKPACRRDYQYKTDKRYKYDITNIENHMDIKVDCFGKLERQIANHLKQIQDRQKQRKKDNINTTRCKIEQISFLSGDLPIVKRNNHYAQILIIKNQINDVIESYFHGKISYVYDSHDNLLNYSGNTAELLDYWEKQLEALRDKIPKSKKVPYTSKELIEALDKGIESN